MYPQPNALNSAAQQPPPPPPPCCMLAAVGGHAARGGAAPYLYAGEQRPSVRHPRTPPGMCFQPLPKPCPRRTATGSRPPDGSWPLHQRRGLHSAATISRRGEERAPRVAHTPQLCVGLPLPAAASGRDALNSAPPPPMHALADPAAPWGTRVRLDWLHCPGAHTIRLQREGCTAGATSARVARGGGASWRSPTNPPSPPHDPRSPGCGTTTTRLTCRAAAAGPRGGVGVAGWGWSHEGALRSPSLRPRVRKVGLVHQPESARRLQNVEIGGVPLRLHGGRLQSSSNEQSVWFVAYSRRECVEPSAICRLDVVYTPGWSGQEKQSTSPFFQGRDFGAREECRG